MSFPKQRDIEVPLLRAIEQLGGEAEPRDVYPLVAEYFPELTEDDREQRLESSPSTRKRWNLVQWARQTLVEAGQTDGSVRGIWKLTDGGRKRLGSSDATPERAGQEEVSLRDLSNASRDAVKARLLEEMKSLTPTAFERFCMELLEQLGYKSVSVTSRGADGGVDGFGDFRQGAVSIKSAFQAKRWTSNPVGRPEIDKLRGAIQGDYDHGVFITTSRFSRDAEAASYKKGAITILLLDGEAIADLMVDRGIGVTREPVYLYDIDVNFFEFDDEDV